VNDILAFTERFPKLLQSGTLVFKATKYREWYSEGVIPWVHYIPVKQDLSDLPDKVRWAMSHKDLAETIVLQARTVVERHLRPQDQRCYAYRLFLEYESVFLQLKQQRPG
jgi:Glycosyl transferase family 90